MAFFYFDNFKFDIREAQVTVVWNEKIKQLIIQKRPTILVNQYVLWYFKELGS